HVKWSDGKPLTAADVLFTFQLIKKNKALDLQAVWSVLKSVTRSGSKVTFKFKTAAVPYFYYVAGQTPIVAQHLWKSVKNPVNFNLTNPLLKAVAVRQAMAYAIDRSRVSKIGEYGYEPAANQTGIVTPTFKSWLNKSLAKKFTYNPTKAKQILTKAGYKFSGGVFHTKSGQPLSFTMINIGGYSDWVASAQIVQQNLKAVGIKVAEIGRASCRER